MSEGLRFVFEPVDPAGARGEELRATWARLQVWVGDECVTQHANEKTRLLSDSIYLPLYPLAEWMACNWWVLFEESFNPKRTTPAQYHKKHSLVGASEGFALPDLSFEPEGDNLRVQWRSRHHEWAGIRFVNAGGTLLPAEAIKNVFQDLIENVAGWLEHRGVQNSFLQEEWAAIRALDIDEVKFCIAAAKLGRDPFNLSEGEQVAITGAASRWDNEGLTEALAAIDSNRVTQALRELQQREDDLAGHLRAFAKIAGFRQSRSEHIQWSRSDPWQIGYDYARSLRKYLGAADAFSTGKFDRLLGVEKGSEVDHQLSEPLRAIDAIVVQQDGNYALAFANAKGALSRFARYRAVFEMLASGEASRLALVSGAYTPRQKANRAFAAEFLAPASALRRHFEKHEVDEESISEVAHSLGVPSTMIRHQLSNHNIVPEERIPRYQMGR